MMLVMGFSLGNWCLLLSWALQGTTTDRNIYSLTTIATILPLFLMIGEYYFDAIFVKGYPFCCSPLMYTNVSCCVVFLSSVVSAPILGVLFLCRLVLNIVAQCRRRRAYARLPVRQVPGTQHYVFHAGSSSKPRNQFVLDASRSTTDPFTMEQVATFMLDQEGQKLLWLDNGNFYLGALPYGNNFKPLLAYQFDANTDTDTRLIVLFSRDDVAADDNIAWPAIDLLISMGTTSAYFSLSTFVIERKLLTAKGLEGFLQHSPNLATLHMFSVYLDAECCRLLGKTSESSWTLSVSHCKLENPGALGDGMRQNGGPTELVLGGAGFIDSSFSLGSLQTNTKLESLSLINFPCFFEDRMEAFLHALSAQGLRRIEFSTPHNGLLGFTPCAWAKLWNFLSRHSSITTLSFIDTGAFAVKPIEDALASNFIITTIIVSQPELSDESASHWSEHVYSCLKRNRRLVHFTRVYRLIRENVQSLVNGEWDVNRAADT
jgi:hypothetical protein